MEQTQVAVMTPEQLREFATTVARETIAQTSDTAATETDPGKRYVYGLRGIRELFHVSHPTAQRYKNTFLAPAVTQRGRKIITDVAKAMELYKTANL